jgi:predicted permease
MNVINVSLFTPALLFSKVAFSLSPSKLKEMWIIPVGFVVISSVSALIAWTLGGILRLTKSQRWVYA